MQTVSKTIEHTVIVVSKKLNKEEAKAFRELERKYKDLLEEAVDFALENNIKTFGQMQKHLYRKFREKHPELPTRIIKGVLTDALRRVKSFNQLKKKGQTYTDRPQIRSITVVYGDKQDWKFEQDKIKLRIKPSRDGWIEIPIKPNKFLKKHLEEGWKLAQELKFKLLGKRLVFFLVFKKEFEVEYEERNVVAVDVNENNVTVAVFLDGKFAFAEMILTDLGRIVIAYAEKRRRIMKGHSWTERIIRKLLKKLRGRERNRKEDILNKVVKHISDLAIQFNAVVVIGDVGSHKKKIVGRQKKRTLRHRLHQWAVQKLVEKLENKPVQVELINEAKTSSWDFLTGKKIERWAPLMTRVAQRRGQFFQFVKVEKIKLRYGKVGSRWIERDFNGAINIGLRWLRKLSPQMGGVQPFTPTGAHDAPVVRIHGGRGANPSPSPGSSPGVREVCRVAIVIIKNC